MNLSQGLLPSFPPGTKASLLTADSLCSLQDLWYSWHLQPAKSILPILGSYVELSCHWVFTSLLPRKSPWTVFLTLNRNQQMFSTLQFSVQLLSFQLFCLLQLLSFTSSLHSSSFCPIFCYTNSISYSNLKGGCPPPLESQTPVNFVIWDTCHKICPHQPWLAAGSAHRAS